MIKNMFHNQLITKNAKEYGFRKLRKRMDQNKNSEFCYYYKTIFKVRKILFSPDIDKEYKNKKIVFKHLESIHPHNLRYLYSYKWWDPKEKKRDDHNLSDTNLFASLTDTNLINYLNYFIKKDKGIREDLHDIIKKSLGKLKNLNNSSILGLTRLCDEIFKKINEEEVPKNDSLDVFESPNDELLSDDEQLLEQPTRQSLYINKREKCQDNPFEISKNKEIKNDEKEEYFSEKKKSLNIRLTIHRRVEDEEDHELKNNFDVLEKFKINTSKSIDKKFNNLFKKTSENVRSSNKKDYIESNLDQEKYSAKKKLFSSPSTNIKKDLALKQISASTLFRKSIIKNNNPSIILRNIEDDERYL